jgi:hypothetical protein
MVIRCKDPGGVAPRAEIPGLLQIMCRFAIAGPIFEFAQKPIT